MKKLTIEKQKEIALERIAIYKNQLYMYNVASEVLKDYDGKKISKRMATAIQKAIGDKYYVYYDTRYNLKHINIEPYQRINQYDSCRLLIAYDEEIFNFEKFQSKAKCYSLNAERIPKLELGLTHIPEMIAKRDKIIEQIEELKDQAESYEMAYDFKIN